MNCITLCTFPTQIDIVTYIFDSVVQRMYIVVISNTAYQGLRTNIRSFHNIDITASYVSRKSALLAIIPVILVVVQQKVGEPTQNHPRLPTLEPTPPLPIQSLLSFIKMTPWIPFSRTSLRLKDMIRYFIPYSKICLGQTRNSPCWWTICYQRMEWIY